MKKKINIALVGCGRISSNHLQAIYYFKKINLVAICDNELIKINKLSKKLNIPGYNNIEKMIKFHKLDLIVLCTPSGLHAKHSIIAFKNKINVLTEKPMATNLKDAIKMNYMAKKIK